MGHAGAIVSGGRGHRGVQGGGARGGRVPRRGLADELPRSSARPGTGASARRRRPLPVRLRPLGDAAGAVGDRRPPDDVDWTDRRGGPGTWKEDRRRGAHEQSDGPRRGRRPRHRPRRSPSTTRGPSTDRGPLRRPPAARRRPRPHLARPVQRGRAVGDRERRAGRLPRRPHRARRRGRLGASGSSSGSTPTGSSRSPPSRTTLLGALAGRWIELLEEELGPPAARGEALDPRPGRADRRVLAPGRRRPRRDLRLGASRLLGCATTGWTRRA